MYKRDLITAEIQQLVKALAQLMGLKLEGKKDEADQLFESTLQDEFGLTTKDLLSPDDSAFESHLKTQAFKAEKLELLSQLLHTKIENDDALQANRFIALKLLQLYSFIEKEYHISSFENINRQSRIKRFLDNFSADIEQ